MKISLHNPYSTLSTIHKHGLRLTTLRGKKKLSMQAMSCFLRYEFKKVGKLD